MERTDAAETREQKKGRDPFERFVDLSTTLISRAPFFAVCVAVVVIWAASYPLWTSTTKWELAIHTFGGVLSLLLLVLLENAARRNTEAMQEKLNVIAEADHITPPCQSERVMELVGSADKDVFRVKGGHIGIMAGRGAEKSTWPHIDAWLAARSG